MAGPMTAYRCDVTSVLAAHAACQPTKFVLTFAKCCNLTLSTLHIPSVLICLTFSKAEIELRVAPKKVPNVWKITFRAKV